MTDFLYYLLTVIATAWLVTFLNGIKRMFAEREMHGASIGIFLIIIYLSFLGVMFMVALLNVIWS